MKHNSTNSSYEKYINSFQLLTVEKEVELVNSYNNGDEKAKTLFYNSNLRLVVFVASRYNSFINNHNVLEFMDLVQAGNIGLLKAMEKFDVKKGFKFSTYATWWIRQAITRFIFDNGLTIRKPVSIHEKISTYKKAKKELETVGKTDPSIELIAQKMGISNKDILLIESLILEKQVSLDSKVGFSENPSQLKDIIPERNTQSLDNLITWDITGTALLKEMRILLSDIEFEILKLRFGLEDGSIYSLKEIAKIYGVSGERIRQLQLSGLARLRRSKTVSRFVKEIFGKNISNSLDTLPALNFREHEKYFRKTIVISFRKIQKEITHVPSGWMNAKKISFTKGLIGNDQTIVRLANSYRKNNPEWFNFYLFMGRKVEYYHPDLVREILKIFLDRVPPPPKWVTANKLGTKKNSPFSVQTIKSLVEKHRNSNPEWFRAYWIYNRFAEHYHPELVKLIINLSKSSIESQYKDWMSAYKLNANGFGHYRLIKLFVERYRVSNPEWFKTFKPQKSSRESEHYHPDLILLIKARFPEKEIKKVSKVKHPKDVRDWMSAYKIDTHYDIGCSKSTMKRFFEKYRFTNPEWFKSIKLNDSLSREYYSPELINLLFEYYKRPKSGWRTANNLSKRNRLQAILKQLKKFVTQYKFTNPDWFEDYWLINGFYTHYHPDLVKLIRENCKT